MTTSIERELFINAPQERVFQALTEKEELERWFVQKADVDLRPGGALRFEWAADAVEVGTFQSIEPSHRLRYSWEALEPSPTTITFDLASENGGTRVHLNHSGIGDGEVWQNYAAAINNGWNIHLNNLTSWLETGTCKTPGATGTLAQSVNE